MDFQEVIIRLERFWADQGCLIWQPYNIQVGAGTMNPATVLRVLGPEPWNVGYVEPSIRPALTRCWQERTQTCTRLRQAEANRGACRGRVASRLWRWRR